ncbi:MAG: hypothetical protein QXU35_08510 [Zestosphaera sp.]
MASWVDSLDLSRVGDDDRYRILEYLINRLGKDKVQEALGVSRVTLWRLLNR